MRFYTIFLLILIFQFLNCSSNKSCCIITIPPITFASERTALENQIIGSYKKIREDILLISSAQTIEGLQISSDTNKKIQTFSKKLLDAYNTQEYNKDEIENLKREGIIGENNEGFLEYLGNPEIEKNLKNKERILKIISEENEARLTFMLEVINLNKNLTIDDLPVVKQNFAKIYQDKLNKGEFYQLPDGRWVKK